MWDDTWQFCAVWHAKQSPKICQVKSAETFQGQGKLLHDDYVYDVMTDEEMEVEIGGRLVGLVQRARSKR